LSLVRAGGPPIFKHAKGDNMNWYQLIFGDEPPMTEDELVEMFAEEDEEDEE